ncbi:MAG: acyltransferase [Tenuifilaceae bacterium]|jgi:acetyltransferase-like isoleucine patch superfamily enzyme|nr:acyltransferase [Tenuifilaceae bacterium]
MFVSRIKMYLLLFIANANKKAFIYNKYLGVTFGVNVRILHYPRFGSEPYLITIGNNVTITRGVCFVNHDGGAAIFRNQYPNLNVYGRITVGDNVFIGINTIILPNVKIGNNVVIGAGSLVNKSIPDNVVAAGVPARIIKSIDEYKESILKKSCIINTKDPIEKRDQIIEYLNNNE